MIELKEIELFKDITFIEIDNSRIDLHNDYECYEMEYSSSQKCIKIYFKSIQMNNKNRLTLFFDSVVLEQMKIIYSHSKDRNTINILYRGRFEKNGILLEQTLDNEIYFYLEFEEGDTFEFFAKKVFIDF